MKIQFINWSLRRHANKLTPIPTKSQLIECADELANTPISGCQRVLERWMARHELRERSKAQ